MVHVRVFSKHVNGLKQSGASFLPLEKRALLIKKCWKSLAMPSFHASSGCFSCFKSHFTARLSGYQEDLHIHEQKLQLFSCKTMDSHVKAHPAFASNFHFKNHLYLKRIPPRICTSEKESQAGSVKA